MLAQIWSQWFQKRKQKYSSCPFEVVGDSYMKSQTIPRNTILLLSTPEGTVFL